MLMADFLQPKTTDELVLIWEMKRERTSFSKQGQDQDPVVSWLWQQNKSVLWVVMLKENQGKIELESNLSGRNLCLWGSGVRFIM